MAVSEESLQGLFLGNSDFDALERALDIFCPFEAIGMIDQEIRHGRFLKYLFDPQKPHGFGSECLRALMTAAAEAMTNVPEKPILPLDVHLMDLDAAIVPQREYKSIDILVEVPSAKVVVAVELKIDAVEHSGQLAKYRRTVEADWPTTEGWRHVLLFLTKRGESPSAEHGEGWTPLPLDSLVSELEAVFQRGGGVSGARALLSDYIGMLRRQHLSDQRLEDLASRLWTQHAEALTFLSDRRPDFRGSLLSAILDQRDSFAMKLSAGSGLTFVSDHSTQAYVRFAVDDWDAVPGMQSGTGWKPSNRLMLLEIGKHRSDSLVMRFELGPGDRDSRIAIFETIKAKGGDVGGNWALSPLWRHLASRILIKVNDDNPPDFETALGMIDTEALKFLQMHLPIYIAAMRELDASGLA